MNNGFDVIKLLRGRTQKKYDENHLTPPLKFLISSSRSELGRHIYSWHYRNNFDKVTFGCTQYNF